MQTRVLPPDGLDLLAGKVRHVLGHVGYLVQHAGVAERLRNAGLRQSAGGRWLFPDTLVDDFVTSQSHGAPPPKSPAHTRGSHPHAWAAFGNICSKYYDHPARVARTGRMAHLEALAKFAHQDARVARINVPVAVTDAPQAVVVLESLLTLMRLTDKCGCHAEPYAAAEIPYLVEISDILLGPGCQNEFVGHCDCMNPVLRLEQRTAGVMLAKADYGIGYLVTSMPAAGGNAPVTVDGTIVQATAEIVGGLIIAWLLNPEADLVGYISSGTMDMAAAVTTQSSPEVVQIDCGTVELMDHAFGGKTRIGGRTYVAARRPGFQAVFEKMFKAAAYQRYGGTFSYAGGGVLDNGSLISPEQLLIDLEIQEGLRRLSSVAVGAEPVEDLIATVAGQGTGDFLSTDHTLSHYRGALWEPRLFARGETGSEESILDAAHERYMDTVNSYPGCDADEEKVRAVSAVLASARRALL